MSSYGTRPSFQPAPCDQAGRGKEPLPVPRLGASPASCQPIEPLESPQTTLRESAGQLRKLSRNSEKVFAL